MKISQFLNSNNTVQWMPIYDFGIIIITFGNILGSSKIIDVHGILWAEVSFSIFYFRDGAAKELNHDRSFFDAEFPNVLS